MKFINKKLFVASLIIIFTGVFISLYPRMVVSNLHRRYESADLINDQELRKQIKEELTFHLTFFEKFSATINPVGTMMSILGILLMILSLAWKFLE